MMLMYANDDAPADVEDGAAYHIDVVMMMMMAGADDNDG